MYQQHINKHRASSASHIYVIGMGIVYGDSYQSTQWGCFGHVMTSFSRASRKSVSENWLLLQGFALLVEIGKSFLYCKLSSALTLMLQVYIIHPQVCTIDKILEKTNKRVSLSKSMHGYIWKTYMVILASEKLFLPHQCIH